LSAVRDYSDLLNDILSTCEKILLFTEGMDCAGFTHDPKTIFAVIHALEIIGEAAKRIPEDVRRKYPQIPWREMAAIRDKLIHDYYEINPEVLWKTIREDIPNLLDQLKHITG
jgi:uncharacterized protein with HEPN domain